MRSLKNRELWPSLKVLSKMLTYCSVALVAPDAVLVYLGQQGAPMLGSAADPFPIVPSPAKSGTAVAPISLDSSPPLLPHQAVVDASSSPIRLPHRRRRPVVHDSSSSPVRPAVRRRISNVDDDDDNEET